MRILFASLASHGYVYPAARIALELKARRHEVALATGVGFAGELARHGLVRVPRTDRDGPSFEVSAWALPAHVAMQVKHLEYAVAMFRPDVMVGHMLTMGANIVAERHRLPLVVLGMATYLWPCWRGLELGRPLTAAEERARWRCVEHCRIYNEARRALRMPEVSLSGFEDHPLLGDRFLVQSVAELEGARSLPARASLAGHWLWEPEHADAPSHPFLRDAIDAGDAVVYAQPGRTFGAGTFWSSLVDASSDLGLRVIASVGRTDVPLGNLPAHVLALPHVPQGAVLRHAIAAVGNGHSTMALGSLAAGVPMVLVPNGSGTEDIAARCAEAGAAIALPPGPVSREAMREALTRCAGEAALRDSARRLAAAFATIDGARAAADAVEHVHEGACKAA